MLTSLQQSSFLKLCVYTHTLNANLRHDTIHCIEHKGGKYIPLLSLRLKDC